MVPAERPNTKNIYDEWFYIDNQWERLGSTEVNLENYVTFDNIKSGKNIKITKNEDNDLLIDNIQEIIMDFPEYIITNDTMTELIASLDENDTPTGVIYFGGITCSDLPDGLLQGELKIEVVKNSDNLNVYYFTIVSTEVPPYQWTATGYQGDFSGWQARPTTEDLSKKQDVLTIDDSPIENSDNLVKSGGIFAALANKVNADENKTLSEEDFTSELKAKLENIEDGAEANTIEEILVNGVAQQALEKVVNLLVPDNLQNGEAEGSLKTKTGKVLSKNAMALAENSIAGAKAFKIVGFDDTNKTYTLDSAEGLAVGDTYSLVIQNNYDDWGTITAINDKTVTVSNYIADVTSEGAERYFRVPLKPECGTVDFGESAVSLGELCMAVAFAAFSEGYNNKIIGKYGHGEGKNNEVGYAAHAENRDNKALGVNSHVGGGQSVADPSAYCAFLHANKGYVKAQCGVGFGESPNVEGTSGFVSGGRANSVSGDCGFTGGGELNSSEGKNSVSTGYMSKACSENQRVHGKHNIKDANGKYVDIVGNGKSNTERSNAYTLDWNGNAWFSGDIESEKYGKLSEKIAMLGQVFSEFALAICKDTVAGAKGFKITNVSASDTISDLTLSSVNGIAINDYCVLKTSTAKTKLKITAVSGNVITVEGVVDALGDDESDNWLCIIGKPGIGDIDIDSAGAVALGIATAAYAMGAFAAGKDNIAANLYSAAFGRDTISGYCGFSEGRATQALGDYGHAEGYGTKVLSDYGHAEGCETVTKERFGHSEGRGTIAHYNQHVEGRYNTEDTENKYVHITGNGTSDTKRSNAHAVDWSGNAWFAGEVESKKYGKLSNKVDKADGKGLSQIENATITQELDSVKQVNKTTINLKDQTEDSQTLQVYDIDAIDTLFKNKIDFGKKVSIVNEDFNEYFSNFTLDAVRYDYSNTDSNNYIEQWSGYLFAGRYDDSFGYSTYIQLDIGNSIRFRVTHDNVNYVWGSWTDITDVITKSNITSAVRAVRPASATTISETLSVNTIYDIGTRTAVSLKLPKGQLGDFIQVDFLTGSDAATVTVDATSCAISDFDLITEANTIYSLYFDWGVLGYDSTNSKYIYGWRFSDSEYTYTGGNT